MKKSSLIIAAIVAIIVGVAAFLVIDGCGCSCSSASESKRAKIEQPFVCYFNLEQLAQKGAFDKFILPEQRRLAASVASANILDSAVATHAEAVIVDLATSGLDITRPAYGYLYEDKQTMVFVAEVANVDNLDKTVDVLSYFAEQEGAILTKEIVGGDRYLYLDNAVLCYNDSRVAVVLEDGDDAKSIATEVLGGLLLDLSLFGDADVAYYVDINDMIDIVENNMANDLEYENVDDGGQRVNLLDKYRACFEQDAYFVSSALFDAGRIVVDSYVKGLKDGLYSGVNKEVELNHLNYVSSDVLALIGGGVNGVKMAALLEAMLNSEEAAMLGLRSNNELNMAMAIAIDAIETIDGDVTIALQSLDGEYKEQVDYFWGGVEYRPIINSVSAALMADVTDTYIITNLGEFAGGLLHKVGDNHYMSQFGDYAVCLKQSDSMLFAGVNMSAKESEKPATKARWIADIEGSVGYFVVDIDKVVNTKFVRSVSEIVMENIDYPKLYSQLMQMFSYAYVTAYSDGSSKLVFVLDDATTNALEQLSGVVLPVVVNESLKSIM
ncbi:MAG: DUF4836 family protein [Rikenellaceae bacterium]|nr:DUF4836 family protein [Rikenellaceae bacterium]